MDAEHPLTLISDHDWKPLEGLPFVVHTMLPGFRSARAAIEIDCASKPLSAIALIFHAKDYENLSAAFSEKGDDNEKIVAIEWSKSHIRGVARIFSRFLPRFNVLLFKKESFDLLMDSNLRPELTGEARFRAEMPLAMWDAA